MRKLQDVHEDILTAVESAGAVQVPGFVSFKFAGRSGGSIRLIRRNGNETTIPYSTICKAIEAVRSDHSVYLGGPLRLREYGITHVNSPTWALVRVLPLNKLID
jgi:hypothetical protein